MKEQLKKKFESSNGTIDKEYQINQKGQRHGIFKSYYFNSKLAYQSEYKNGQMNGLIKWNTMNGSFESIEIRKKTESFGLDITFAYMKKRFT